MRCVCPRCCSCSLCRFVSSLRENVDALVCGICLEFQENECFYFRLFVLGMSRSISGSLHLRMSQSCCLSDLKLLKVLPAWDSNLMSGEVCRKRLVFRFDVQVVVFAVILSAKRRSSTLVYAELISNFRNWFVSTFDFYFALELLGSIFGSLH